jgi:tetratricopeptide (TPR) repeat protein
MRIATTRAFVEAMAVMGDYCFHQYEHGNRDVIEVLMAQEANLLHARSLARSNAWCDPVIGTMQGLCQLYQHTERIAEWSRLVEEIAPDFMDRSTQGPLQGKEKAWNLVTGYRVMLAVRGRRWDDAEHLQSMLVHWDRHRAASILARSPGDWSAEEKAVLRFLAVDLLRLSEIQREQGLVSCVAGYREGLSLAKSIQEFQEAAVCAYNLGRAYEELPEIRDLALAEQWYRRSLDRHKKEDRLGRARCLKQLGSVAHCRFVETAKARRPAEECLKYLSQARDCTEQALNLTPANAARDLATTHNQLGNIYRDVGEIQMALHHYRESIRYWEGMQGRFQAGQNRYNAAITLAMAGHFPDARDWAQAALRDFQAAENADQDVVRTLQLLERIESALRGTSPPPSAHLPPRH